MSEATFTTELIASELVTNAIRYAKPPVRPRLIRRHVLTCEISGASSTSPRLRHARTADEGGRGLLLVAWCSERWGTRCIDAQGAATSVLLATSPVLNGVTGRYFEDNQEAQVVRGNEDQPRGVAAHALDPRAADRLWEYAR